MAPDTLRKVAAAVIIVTSGMLLAASPFLQFNLGIFPDAAWLRRGTEAGISAVLMSRLVATLLIFGSMYLAGWAVWHRRRWGVFLFLAVLPLYFALGFFAPQARPGAIFWLSVLVLSLSFELLLVHARKAELYAPRAVPGPPASSPPGAAFAALGGLAAALAIALLATAIGFSRIAHPLTLAVSIGVAIAIAALLVLCGWRPWNRVLALILLGAASCLLIAVAALRFADLAQWPPLSRIPILAAGGFLYRASLGMDLQILLMGFLEGALVGAMLLLLAGIPLLVSPPRSRPVGPIAMRLSPHAVPVLLATVGVALAIPAAIEWSASPQPAPPPRSMRPERASLPDLPPPPPSSSPAPRAPPGPKDIVEGPIARGAEAGIPGFMAGDPERKPDRVAAAAPSPPVAVAFASLDVIRRVAPAYPPAASGKSGVAILEATVDRNGHVVKARAIRGDRDDFVEAGSQALLQWRFAPYQVAGEPREVKTVVTFHFRPQ